MIVELHALKSEKSGRRKSKLGEFKQTLDESLSKVNDESTCDGLIPEAANV